MADDRARASGAGTFSGEHPAAVSPRLALSDARTALTLIGVALFLAIGLEPVVNWLVHHRFRRWAAVTTVSLGALALVAGLPAIAIPPLSSRPRS